MDDFFGRLRLTGLSLFGGDGRIEIELRHHLLGRFVHRRERVVSHSLGFARIITEDQLGFLVSEVEARTVVLAVIGVAAAAEERRQVETAVIGDRDAGVVIIIRRIVERQIGHAVGDRLTEVDLITLDQHLTLGRAVLRQIDLLNRMQTLRRLDQMLTVLASSGEPGLQGDDRLRHRFPDRTTLGNLLAEVRCRLGRTQSRRPVAIGGLALQQPGRVRLQCLGLVHDIGSEFLTHDDQMHTSRTSLGTDLVRQLRDPRPVLVLLGRLNPRPFQIRVSLNSLRRPATGIDETVELVDEDEHAPRLNLVGKFGDLRRTVLGVQAHTPAHLGVGVFERGPGIVERRGHRQCPILGELEVRGTLLHIDEQHVPASDDRTIGDVLRRGRLTGAGRTDEHDVRRIGRVIEHRRPLDADREVEAFVDDRAVEVVAD